ncbi:SOH1-domain-containing protein [Rhizodiscina lignyota]|uniref:Mediator of RNA polymerase II transcription subunit 31 n=1 Tax=Rhizodiscina lignyota TaxID=1504668 RepID=A0A9P4M819_9PEZI|nr:SOH1-domain-containing protein [Rhizodiscina lignyota]
MADQTPQNPPEPCYGGYSRFELELEFVQSLANPEYLNYLATQKYFDDPAFINYLDYLRYWREPKYIKYLTYPGPTLKALELLQQRQFREDIKLPELMFAMMERNVAASFEAH